MKKYFKILSSDARFARMIELELYDIGAELFTESTKLSDSDEKFIIADLDSCNEEELTINKTNATIIGFSQHHSNDISAKSQFCSTVLSRPFLTSDLLSIFLKDGSFKNTERVSKPILLGKKKNYLSVDPTDKTALWGETRIALSENEYKVLSILCENRGEIVERSRIDELLGSDESNMGDVYICHLRRKIDNSLGLRLIYTVRGKGYMLKN